MQSNVLSGLTVTQFPPYIQQRRYHASSCTILGRRRENHSIVPYASTRSRLCGDLYRVCRALGFACQAFYAIFLPRGVRLLLRRWMPGTLSPIEQRDGTHFEADSISSTRVPINSHVGSVNTEFLRRLNRPPHVVTVVLTYNLSTLLKIRIYRQNDTTEVLLENRSNINLFPTRDEFILAKV
jgi:hypothetical protein